MTEHPSLPAPRVGDHPAMDFLNTLATPGGVASEGLATGNDLLNWLEQAELIEAGTAAKFRSDKTAAAQLEVIAKGARALREWFRAFVRRHAGHKLAAAAEAELGPLNLLLAGDKSYARVGGSSEGLALQRLRRWESPEELLQPIAAAIADLVCHADFRLIRACEGHDCTLMFLDRTKAHARRWCSMALCGNRAKAAAHRARNRV
jgi:predicted RNA-binding Zn ribbon-like protein